MTTEEATLIAAGIAATASISSLAISLRQKYRSELREVQRHSLEKVVAELGNEIYSVIAKSKRMGASESDEDFQKNIELAINSARRIDDLRRDVRYSLWGLNDALHMLTLLPRWVEFLRGNGISTDEIICIATKLRTELDKCIKSCYQNGAFPSRLAIFRIKFRIRKLRNYYYAKKSLVK